MQLKTVNGAFSYQLTIHGHEPIMGIRRMFQTVKDVWMNHRYLKQQRKEKPQSRAALTSKEFDEACARLRTATEGDETLRKDLDMIQSTAEEKLHYAWWIRRFMFGFGVAKSIDEWFEAFDNADAKIPLLERIPRRETSNVAAKWVWFGVFTTFIAVLLSVSVGGITAYFLYQQTNVLAKQETNARETSSNAQRTQYLQILYDEKCEIQAQISEPESPEITDSTVDIETCEPLYNRRVRAEAAIAFYKLQRSEFIIPDLRGANLKNALLFGAYLRGGNLSGVNLNKADMRSADLRRTRLTGADLRGAVIGLTDFHGAYFHGANLRGAFAGSAIFSEANLLKANLMEADLNRVNLDGADLSEANLLRTNVTQSQLDSACGDEETKLPEGLTIKTCPNELSTAIIVEGK